MHLLRFVFSDMNSPRPCRSFHDFQSKRSLTVSLVLLHPAAPMYSVTPTFWPVGVTGPYWNSGRRADRCGAWLIWLQDTSKSLFNAGGRMSHCHEWSGISRRGVFFYTQGVKREKQEDAAESPHCIAAGSKGETGGGEQGVGERRAGVSSLT